MDIAFWSGAALLLLGLLSFIVLWQHRFIYFPLRYSTGQLEKAKIAGAQEIRYRTSQGNQSAFFWRDGISEMAPQTLWLFFAGNGDVALAWLGLVRVFPVRQAGYLLIDYPGYGICEGKPNPQTILENSEAALQTLLAAKGWKIDSDRLRVLGHSLGGAAALQFAAKHVVGKILLVSTFTSMDDMVRTQIHIPLRRLLRHRFDNVASLKTILSQSETPEILIFHGQADEIVPAHMGRTLAQLNPNRIQFDEIPGARHNDVLQMPLSRSLQSALFGQIVEE
jgi:uncharacterized protein